MEENLKVDEKYLDAFNRGYELAKELRLESPMFTNSDTENSSLSPINDGMEEYSRESKHRKMEQSRANSKGFDLSK